MPEPSPFPAPIDQLCVNAIRTLAMDAVEAARSGHPGMPMGMAPVAYTLWQRHLRYDRRDPAWLDRDRFVLSAGHGSALLYALLHLCRVRRAGPTDALAAPLAAGGGSADLAVGLDDLRRFRQLGGICPGHPEYRLTSGVECTTGPLGQGLAASTGMAIAARRLGALYNRPEREIVSHRVWAICSDGDLMEGVSSECASLAGHLRLSNLVWIYDSNQITIDGSTDLTFGEDVAFRFTALGWRVLDVADANDLAALDRALRESSAPPDADTERRPTLVVVHSRIGYGAPHKEGTSSAHGEPLGAAEVRGAKEAYGWPLEPAFHVPPAVYEHFESGIAKRGQEVRAAWQTHYDGLRADEPAAAVELETMFARGLPEGWDRDLPIVPAEAKDVATRVTSGQALQALAARIPWMLGGSADLGSSVRTILENQPSLSAADPLGRNLRFGIREHAMGGICNGLALSGLRPFASTFLVFSDYLRPALRLSAIMGLPVAWVFSHDSVFTGEDGPTHQPIEHLASLRAIPGLLVLRPADAGETVEAWRVIAELRDQPAALILSRQALPVVDRSRYAPAAGLRRGGYVLAEAPGGKPRVILVGTGSEVALCLQARETLARAGIMARVVSLPSWELFEQQSAAYRAAVLPPDVSARVAVEAASPLGWERYAGEMGVILAMRGFGESAPARDLAPRFGFTPEAVAEAARLALG